YIEYSIQLLKVTMIRVFCQMQLLATFFYAHKVHYTKLLCNSNYENRLLKLTHNISPHRSKRESLGIKAYLCPVLFSISSFITVINCSIGSDSDFFSPYLLAFTLFASISLSPMTSANGIFFVCASLIL